MARAEPFTGTQRFAIERPLGEGGVGMVYLAYDREQRCQVALKTLTHVDPSNLYRFKKEFRALAGVSHPNLVVLHDLFSEGELWFFTMEYVDGVDFSSYLRALSPVPFDPTISQEVRIDPLRDREREHDSDSRSFDSQPPPRARMSPQHESRLRDTLRQLAIGIATLHGHDKLHKDIKPSNVLITRDGRVVLVDFGMIADQGARLDFTIEDKMFGTPAYMSPEQASGEAVGPASDWYSFGVMLFEALTGKLPFDGSTLDMLIDKQTKAAPSLVDCPAPRDLSALCSELLIRDPAARPSGQSVVRRLTGDYLDAVFDGGTRALPAGGLVGRVHELASLHDAFGRARGGSVNVVLISGRSGIGKSALARHFMAELVEREQAVVLAGRCYERESVPFKAIDSVIDALCRFLVRLHDDEIIPLLPRNVQALARLFPVLRQVEVIDSSRLGGSDVPDLQELRRRGFGALKELLARVADTRPLVLCIDDVHWGDAESAQLLDHLLRPPEAPAMLVVCCHRQQPVLGPVLDHLQRSDAGVPIERIELGPLSLEDATQLTRGELGALGIDTLSDAEVQRIAAEAEGSPFFIGELVIARKRQVADARSEQAPISLNRVLRERIDRLPERARQLLELIAVAGRPIEQGLALSSAGDRLELADLDVLRAAHLVRTHGSRERDAVECYHDRVRKAVLDQIDPAQLTRHHLRLGETIERGLRYEPDALAHHFHLAGHTERASDYGLLAARQAADALAFDRSADLYAWVLGLPVLEGLKRADVQAEHADTLANAGRSAEAAQAYLASARASVAPAAFERERMAAEHFLRSGHVEEGLDTLQRVLSSLGLALPKTPQRALLSLAARRVRLALRGLRHRMRTEHSLSREQLSLIDTCWSASVGLGLIDFVRGADFQTRHLLLALEAGEPYRLARALALEAGYLAADGGKSETRVRDVLQATERILQEHPHPHAAALTRLAYAMGAWHLGHWRVSVQHCLLAERSMRETCTGVAWEIATTQIFEAAALYYLGEWTTLLPKSRANLREAMARRDFYAVSDLQTGVHVVRYLAADEVTTARAVLAEEKTRWTKAGFHLQHWNQLFADNMIDFYAGEGLRAHARVTQRWAALTRSLVLQVQIIRIEALQLRALSAIAAAMHAPPEREVLLKKALADAASIRAERRPWATPLARLIAGLCELQRNDVTRAAVELRAAAAGLEAAEMKLHAAAARARLGLALGGTEGRALIDAACGMLAAQGVKNPNRMLQALAPAPDPNLE